MASVWMLLSPPAAWGSTLANSLLTIFIAGPCGIPSALMSRKSEFCTVTPDGVSEG